VWRIIIGNWEKLLAGNEDKKKELNNLGQETDRKYRRKGKEKVFIWSLTFGSPGDIIRSDGVSSSGRTSNPNTTK